MSTLTVGLTGGIASGKSEVLRILASRGVPTTSSDALAHACLESEPIKRAVLRRFGRDLLAPSGRIDRKTLGRIVFAKPAERRWLEHRIHPCVRRGLSRFARRHHGLVVLDIPLLFEARMEKEVDVIVVVSCSRGEQIRRLMSRDGLTRTEALQRLRAQMPLAAKRRRADVVIVNAGGRSALRSQVSRVLTHLRKKI